LAKIDTSEFIPLKFRSASQEQKCLAGKLGINVENDSWELAKAKILDTIGEAIGEPVRQPTVAQIQLANQLGLDIENDSFQIAFAKIAEYVAKENIKAINEQELAPEVLVIAFGSVRVISTITPTGYIYFKGSGSPQGPAGKCVRCNDDVLEIMITRLQVDLQDHNFSVLNCVAALEWTVRNREINSAEKLKLIKLGENLGGLLQITLQRLGINSANS
jgi:hypothetical protein